MFITQKKVSYLITYSYRASETCLAQANLQIQGSGL